MFKKKEQIFDKDGDEIELEKEELAKESPKEPAKEPAKEPGKESPVDFKKEISDTIRSTIEEEKRTEAKKKGEADVKTFWEQVKGGAKNIKEKFGEELDFASLEKPKQDGSTEIAGYHLMHQILKIKNPDYDKSPAETVYWYNKMAEGSLGKTDEAQTTTTPKNIAGEKNVEAEFSKLPTTIRKSVEDFIEAWTPNWEETATKKNTDVSKFTADKIYQQKKETVDSYNEKLNK